MAVLRDLTLQVVIDPTCERLERRVGTDIFQCVFDAVNRNLHLLPRWCEELHITYEPNEEDESDDIVMTMTTELPYHRCTLTLYDEVEFIIGAEGRGEEWFVIHEFMHTHVEKAVSLFDVLFRSKPSCSSMLNEVAHENLESTICGLTDMILRDRKHSQGVF